MLNAIILKCFKLFCNVFYGGLLDVAWVGDGGWLCPHLLDHLKTLWKNMNNEMSRNLRPPNPFFHEEMVTWKSTPHHLGQPWSINVVDSVRTLLSLGLNNAKYKFNVHLMFNWAYWFFLTHSLSYHSSRNVSITYLEKFPFFSQSQLLFYKFLWLIKITVQWST